MNDKLRFLIYDFSLATEHAVRIARDGHIVRYFTPYITAFPQFENYAPGLGLEGIEKVKDFFDKEEINSADIIMFPDVGAGDLCTFLRDLGYTVYGAGLKGENLERHRFETRQLQKKLGLPTQRTVLVNGVDGIRKFLQKNGDVFIKLDEFRGDIECVSEDTEILTDKGWKYFKDLNPQEDKVLSLDLNTRKASFVKINNYFKSFYNGKMYHIKGRSIDLLVTPKHKFFVKSNYTLKKWKYLPIEEIKDWYSLRIPIAFQKEGITLKHYQIPSVEASTHKEANSEREIEINLWLQFLGWFLSEGSLDRPNEKYRIVISQSKEKHYEKWQEIEKLLTQFGYNFQYEQENGFSIYNKALWEHLAEICYAGNELKGYAKKIPDFIFELSPDLIEIFLDAFLKGDGCVEGKYKRYYTTSPFLADGLQRLILFTGKGSSISWRKRKDEWNVCYCITERKTKDISLRKVKENIKETHYEGFVYDVTVEPYHSILIRRNGKVCWTGNSFYAKDYESVETLLDDIEVKLGPFKNAYNFMIEAMVDGIEPGWDLFFNGEEFLKPYLWGYEFHSIYIGVYCDELPRPLKVVADKFAPILRAYDYRGAISAEMIIDKNNRPFLIDITARFPFPLSAIYTESIENYSDVIINIANKRPVELKNKWKYVGCLPLESSYAKDNWLKLNFDKSLRNSIKLRIGAANNGKFYAVKGFTSVAVLVAGGNSVDEVIEKLISLTDKIDAHHLDKEMTGGLYKIKEIIRKGVRQGLTFK